MGVVTSQTKRNAHRILLVDDHPVVREGLRRLLSQEPDFDVCGDAEGLPQGVKLFRELRPDLVITDITLGDGNGIELIKDLVAMQPDVKVLVASMHDESLYAERSLRAGARGYINKEQASQAIIDAARRVLHGGMYLSERMTERMLSRAVGSADQPLSAIDTLSDRELEVFEQIGHGVTTRNIAEKLHISRKTVETHREHIKQKLNLSNATELTQHAVQWVLERSAGGRA